MLFGKIILPEVVEASCNLVCGEGGIRTHGTVTRTLDFESSAFDHSATSPTGPFLLP